MGQEKRDYLRYPMKEPILYQVPDSDDFRQAVVCNVSKDGFYIESPHSQQCNTPLYFRQEAVKGICDVKFHLVHIANVKWASRCSNGTVPCYGMGVQYVLKGYLFVSDCPRDAYMCDLCGSMNMNELHVTEEQAYFCEDCFKKVGRLKSPNLRESLIRGLSGNVYYRI